MEAEMIKTTDLEFEGTVPLILSFLEQSNGSNSGTTSGTWNDVDASDRDPA